MTDPVFSIVIPAYNAGAFIGEAIESLLRQETTLPYEIIVVNDGSTDHTAVVVETFGDKVSHIVKPNGGPASARNLGVRAARSDLVLFLDADDRAMPGRFEAQTRYMLDHPGTDVCFGNWIVEGEPDDYLARYGLFAPSGGFVTVGDPFERLLVRGSFIPTSTAAVRRQTYVACGMQPEDRYYAEDYTLWCRIAARGGRFAYCGSALAWYRTASADRLTRSSHIYSGVVQVLYEMLVEHGGLLSPDAYRQAHARFAAAADVLLRHEWAYCGRRRVLDRIAALAPLLPERLRRKWIVLTLVPGVFPRTARFGLYLARRATALVGRER